MRLYSSDDDKKNTKLIFSPALCVTRRGKAFARLRRCLKSSFKGSGTVNEIKNSEQQRFACAKTYEQLLPFSPRQHPKSRKNHHVHNERDLVVPLRPCLVVCA